MLEGNKKGNSKIFFWIFGIIFAIVIYISIKTIPFFSYLNQIMWLPLFISLIIIILFFIIGNFSKKVPFYYISLIFNKNKKNLKDLSLKIEEKETESDIQNLVSKLKNILKIISAYGYSKESSLFLINSIGISKASAEKIIHELKRLRNIKRTCIFLGLFISISVFILISYLPIFEFIKEVTILRFAIPFVILFLFFLEGFLVTRMPQSFYLKLIDLNKETILNNKKLILEKYTNIKKIKDVEKKDIASIKQTIKYLLKEGLKKEWIEQIIKNYGFSSDVSSEFVDEAIKELKELPKDLKEIKLGNAALKLSLAKIEESFSDLKKIYSKLSELQSVVDNLSKRQKELETLSEIAIKKQLKSLSGKNSQLNKQLSETLEKPIISIDLEKLKKLGEDPERNEIVNFLYNLVLPYIKNYSEKELVSLLLYKGYSYELVEDLILKIKNNKKKFGKIEKSAQEKIISKINLLYNLFSKKEKDWLIISIYIYL